MNIVVAQSGGPTCAINASLLGVIKESLKYNEIKKIYGSVNGIEGIIKDRLIDLKEISNSSDNIDLLKQTPATVLGSCRYRLPSLESDRDVYEIIAKRFEENNIKAMFYIGGNDSMDTVSKLYDYFKQTNKDIKVIGIPKTIDNDLCETDHTPGFGSAAKYLATTLSEIIRDSSVYDLKSVTIVEIMGRHAGWLTASSCVLRANGEVAPHLIYLPESKFSVDKFLSDVKEQFKLHKTVIVAISEGVKIEGAKYQSNKIDNFGHSYLSGIGKYLEKIVSDELSCKVRSIELNVMQRCSSHVSSKTDIDESLAVGAAAVKAFFDGENGKMMCFKRVSDNPYSVKIESVDASLVANKEKFFPNEWISENNNNIKDEALNYFLPLIQGEQKIITKNGIPVHFKIDNILD